MSAASPVTEADILDDLAGTNESGLSAEAAESILALHFSERARKRIQRLLEANSRGEIEASDRAELDKYLRVGQFVDLLQAKARLSLEKSRQT
jgi:hypothetical protein